MRATTATLMLAVLLPGCGQDGAAAEVHDVHLLVQFFPNFKVGFNLHGITVGDFRQGVFNGSVVHDHTATYNFQVALFGVHDHVEVLVTAILLPEQRFEHILHHFHHRRAVDVFRLFKILECFDQVNTCHMLQF